MEIEGHRGPYQEVDTQALAVAVFKDEKADDGFLKELDAAAGGVVKSVIDSEEFKGKEGETVYLHLPPGGSLKAEAPASDRCRRESGLSSGASLGVCRNRSSFLYAVRM